jgi:hypothetical protein
MKTEEEIKAMLAEFHKRREINGFLYACAVESDDKKKADDLYRIFFAYGEVVNVLGEVLQ